MDTAFPVKLLSQLRPLLIGFRKSKGLTQRELSARLGASFQRLYKVLNILGVEMSLNSAPILTDARTSKFVEKEFDLPARSEDW